MSFGEDGDPGAGAAGLVCCVGVAGAAGFCRVGGVWAIAAEETDRAAAKTTTAFREMCDKTKLRSYG